MESSITNDAFISCQSCQSKNSSDATNCSQCKADLLPDRPPSVRLIGAGLGRVRVGNTNHNDFSFLM